MKKIIKLGMLVLAVLLIFTMVACSNNDNNEGTSMNLTDDKNDNTTNDENEKNTDSENDDSNANSEDYDLNQGVMDYFANMPDHIYKIGQADFLDKVKAEEDIFVVDIRQAADYEKGHVKGAVNLPWGSAISDGIENIPQDKEVFIYCYSGQTAGQAVMTLNLAGINARSVNLGWNFGISKVEGYEDLTETTVNSLPTDTYKVENDVKKALSDYYTGLADVADGVYKNYKISEDDLKAMIEAKDDFYLLSIRKEEHYAEGHIEGAMNIAWGKGMENSFSSLPKDKKVVVYCYTGQTAGQTVAALRLLGYDAVSLNGGMGMASNAPLGWTNKGYEVVSVNSLDSKVMEYFSNMPDHIYKIGQADFLAKVEAGDDMFVVDIRQAADYEKGHVKGAVNLPWGSAISDGIENIPQDKEVFIYCYSGQTAGQAVMTLNLAGINARSVNLGWNFGISKVEGYEAQTETIVNELPSNKYEVSDDVKMALDAYYKGLADVADGVYKNYKISEDDLKAMIEAKDDFYLLSIRKEEHYAEGHIEGAMNIAWGKGMENSFSSLPKDKKVVVYCYTGQTAGQTVAALRLLGYDAVSLNGGMGMEANAPLGWSNKGYDVVK